MAANLSAEVQPSTRYATRRDAGRILAESLKAYSARRGVVVLGLPRGGVPVAYEVARSLGAPLDVFVVRKLGVPTQPEVAMGAVASGGAVVLNEQVIQWANVPLAAVEGVRRQAVLEIARQEAAFRGGHPPADLRGRTVIVVDDGLATGATMRAAVHAIRDQLPARLVVAVPVGAPESCEAVEQLADELVCPLRPRHFDAVGAFYDTFTQVSDDEVVALLNDVRLSPAKPGDEQC